MVPVDSGLEWVVLAGLCYFWGVWAGEDVTAIDEFDPFLSLM